MKISLQLALLRLQECSLQGRIFLRQQANYIIALLVILALFGIAFIPELGRASQSSRPTVLDALHLNCQDCTTATPNLQVYNQGAGDSIVARATDGTVVWSVSKAGVSSQAGLTLSDGNATIADFSIIVPQTSITLTDAGVLTPTGSFQPITAAGNVTVTLASSGYTAGSRLTILNNSNVTVAITDSGVIMLSSNISLGQYDSAELVFDGTNWIQLGESDN